MGKAETARKEQPMARHMLWLNAATLLLIIVSAFAVVHATHACRALYTSLHRDVRPECPLRFTLFHRLGLTGYISHFAGN